MLTWHARDLGGGIVISKRMGFVERRGGQPANTASKVFIWWPERAGKRIEREEMVR